MKTKAKTRDKNGRTIAFKKTDPPVLEGILVDVGPGEFSCFAELDESLIEPKDWQKFEVGDTIKRMHGSKTSAAFVDVHLLPGFRLRYRGTYDDLTLALVVFDLVSCDEEGDRENLLPPGYRAVYHRFDGDTQWHDTGGSKGNGPCLIFHTPACSSRVVEIDTVA